MRIRALLSCCVALLLAVTVGCGTRPAGGTSTPATHELRITLRSDGSTSPQAASLQVARGTVITLQITSDHADEVHVHGYDKQYPVAAGQERTESFTADQTGRFEIESHHPAVTLVVLDVR